MMDAQGFNSSRHDDNTEFEPTHCVNCDYSFDLVNLTPYKLPCGHTGKSHFLSLTYHF
jgi:hypothetical protein